MTVTRKRACKYQKRLKIRQFPCPRGCGATWNEYVYSYSNSACRKTWWNREGKWFSPMENKACNTVRVIFSCERWVTHPSNPAWRDTKPVKRCC